MDYTSYMYWIPSNTCVRCSDGWKTFDVHLLSCHATGSESPASIVSVAISLLSDINVGGE